MSTQQPTTRTDTQSTPTPPDDQPRTSESWIDKCQPQFDTKHAEPLQNLVDERNAARLDAAYRAGTPTVPHH